MTTNFESNNLEIEKIELLERLQAIQEKKQMIDFLAGEKVKDNLIDL